MAVSDVGRMAIGSSRSDDPLPEGINTGDFRRTKQTNAFVTQATSGEKPSTWFFSLSKTEAETNMGK